MSSVIPSSWMEGLLPWNGTDRRAAAPGNSNPFPPVDATKRARPRRTVPPPRWLERQTKHAVATHMSPWQPVYSHRGRKTSLIWCDLTHLTSAWHTNTLCNVSTVGVHYSTCWAQSDICCFSFFFIAMVTWLYYSCYQGINIPHKQDFSMTMVGRSPCN